MHAFKVNISTYPLLAGKGYIQVAFDIKTKQINGSSQKRQDVYLKVGLYQLQVEPLQVVL